MSDMAANIPQIPAPSALGEGSSSLGGAGVGGVWACSACTFENQPLHLACGCCGTERLPQAPPRSAPGNKGTTDKEIAAKLQAEWDNEVPSLPTDEGEGECPICGDWKDLFRYRDCWEGMGCGACNYCLKSHVKAQLELKPGADVKCWKVGCGESVLEVDMRVLLGKDFPVLVEMHISLKGDNLGADIINCPTPDCQAKVRYARSEATSWDTCV